MDISVLWIDEMELNCKSSCTAETAFDIFFYALLAQCELILCVTVPNPIDRPLVLQLYHQLIKTQNHYEGYYTQ